MSFLLSVYSGTTNVLTQLSTITTDFYSEYSRRTPSRIQLVDAFIVFSVITGLIQLFHMLFITQFPYNSFLSGFFAALGFFVLTVGLRLQLTDPADFGGVSPEKAFASYVACNMLLFFVVVTFMG